MTTPYLPEPGRHDVDRRGRRQEGVAIGLALVVLVATFLVALGPVAEGTVPLASRTGLRADPSLTGGGDGCSMPVSIVVDDGSVTKAGVCPFGSSHHEPARQG